LTMQINDGTGRGYVAKVTSGNRLAVDLDEGALKAAEGGGLYTVTTTSALPSLTMTSTGGVLMYLENTAGSNKNIVIDEVLVSGSASMICSIVLNHVRGTIADETAITPTSSHTATALSAPTGVNAWAWDEANHGIGGITGGAYVLTTLLGTGGPLVIASGSRFIVAPGGSISVYMKNAGEGTAAIRFYEVDA